MEVGRLARTLSTTPGTPADRPPAVTVGASSCQRTRSSLRGGSDESGLGDARPRLLRPWPTGMLAPVRLCGARVGDRPLTCVLASATCRRRAGRAQASTVAGFTCGSDRKKLVSPRMAAAPLHAGGALAGGAVHATDARGRRGAPDVARSQPARPPRQRHGRGRRGHLAATIGPCLAHVGHVSYRLQKYLRCADA